MDAVRCAATPALGLRDGLPYWRLGTNGPQEPATVMRQTEHCNGAKSCAIGMGENACQAVLRATLSGFALYYLVTQCLSVSQSCSGLSNAS